MSIFLFLFDCLPACGHDNSKSNKDILMNNFTWAGSGPRKKWSKYLPDLDQILDTKNCEFQRLHFQGIFTDFGFLVDITRKIMRRSPWTF